MKLIFYWGCLAVFLFAWRWDEPSLNFKNMAIVLWTFGCFLIDEIKNVEVGR